MRRYALYRLPILVNFAFLTFGFTTAATNQVIITPREEAAGGLVHKDETMSCSSADIHRKQLLSESRRWLPEPDLKASHFAGVAGPPGWRERSRTQHPALVYRAADGFMNPTSRGLKQQPPLVILLPHWQTLTKCLFNVFPEVSPKHPVNHTVSPSHSMPRFRMF